MTVVDDGVTGLNVEGRDPAVWASAVRCLLDDPVRLEEMGRRGRDHATRFTWRRAVDALLPVLGGLPADGRLRVAR
jgi:D-inositol-3-phosphate glycosyltransferase